jgi:TPP-dependent pyruvate/acetoin dehydrogenase alpha subunit
MNAALTRDESLELYYYLRLNRSLEELLVRLFRQNKVFGGIYGSLGQEAISVGAAYALGPGDWIAPMVRNIGALLVRGFQPRDILTQHMARLAAPTRGKDSGNHIGDLHVRHVVAPISMLGDLIPVMTGVAIGARYLGQKIVALTWIGDGGSSTGAFHEGLNMAAAQKAPFVLVLENNQWAYATPVARQVPLRDLVQRAGAYGIPSHVVDGNDVAAVVNAVRGAAAHARDGNGPVLVEAKTMRMLGHAQHDAAEYVPPEMLAYWKTRDPITRFEAFLAENRFADASALQAIRERIEKELAADLAFAETSPFPPPELAAQGVYCEDGCHTVEPQWQRDKSELLPPNSAVKAAWTVKDFGDLGSHPAQAGEPGARR